MRPSIGGQLVNHHIITICHLIIINVIIIHPLSLRLEGNSSHHNHHHHHHYFYHDLFFNIYFLCCMRPSIGKQLVKLSHHHDCNQYRLFITWGLQSEGNLSHHLITIIEVVLVHPPHEAFSQRRRHLSLSHRHTIVIVCHLITIVVVIIMHPSHEAFSRKASIL
jgi:hypothetical protein